MKSWMKKESLSTRPRARTRSTLPRRIERKRRVGAQLDLAPYGRDRDPGIPCAQNPPPGVCLKLERREAHRIAVTDEKRDDLRNLLEVAVRHGGVEHDRKAQAARAVDIFLPQRVERNLIAISTALLRHIDVKCDVDQPRDGKLLKQIPLGADAVGEQRWPHAFLVNPAHDRHQL